MKYTIFQVDDSRAGNVKRIESMMKGWERQPNIAVDGSKMEIFPKLWDGATVGQYGVWCSFILSLNMAPILTFDDDAILDADAESLITYYVSQIPEDADFLALYVPPQFKSMFKERHRIGHQFICRAYQPNGAVAMYYTEKGRDNIMKLVQRDGFQMQYDNQLYNYSWYGELKGYTLKPGMSPVKHDDEAPSIVQESKRVHEV